MASAREMRMRIRSVKNISQVTRALEAVSASKVRKAVAAVTATRAYATKAWQVLTHIARQPGRAVLHPLLAHRPQVSNIRDCCSSCNPHLPAKRRSTAWISRLNRQSITISERVLTSSVSR